MSLLDRFVTNGGVSSDLRQSICRNLEMVLEARRPMLDLAETAGTAKRSELDTSLYGYGMGNLHQCRHSARSSDICRELEHLISQFEPRLEGVVVELAKVDASHNALRFHIEAGIRGQGGEIESFDTTINLTNSTLMIDGYN
ncbi:type VI secretion system baseplate subunit TssE [Endozoicomonadaceae bacterium StTr2]